MSLIKQKRWRSKKYKDWVKTLSCCDCGRPADDPHHIIGRGDLSGMGLTAPDWALMPLCRSCHNEIHREIVSLELQWEWALKTIGKALDEGIL